MIYLGVASFLFVIKNIVKDIYLPSKINKRSFLTVCFFNGRSHPFQVIPNSEKPMDCGVIRIHEKTLREMLGEGDFVNIKNACEREHGGDSSYWHCTTSKYLDRHSKMEPVEVDGEMFRCRSPSNISKTCR